MEQQTASFANNLAAGNGFETHGDGSGEVDFESLVKGNAGSPNLTAPTSIDPWDVDSWASGADTSTNLVRGDANIDASLTIENQALPSLTITADNTGNGFPSMPSSPAPLAFSTTRTTAASTSKLKARPVPSSTFNSAAFAAASPPVRPQQPVFPSQPTTPSFATVPSHSTFTPLQPTQTSFAPLQPQSSMTPHRTLPSAGASGPNYSLSLSPQTPAAPTMRPPIQPSHSFNQSQQPASSAPIQPSQPIQPAVKPPPGWSSGLMQPTVAVSSRPKLAANQGWDDFDPLK